MFMAVYKSSGRLRFLILMGFRFCVSLSITSIKVSNTISAFGAGVQVLLFRNFLSIVC